ncbi:MAG TPA: hypothetical protein VLZ11_03715 [Flavobacterium sp.]|nr:hypothetical protein [Flavobacterium sp.]
MRKILLKSAIIGVLFSFAACSSDSGGSSCEDHLAAFDAAEAKYEASGSEADCLAAANIVKNALAAKCISTEEAAAYAADLPCYTSGGDDNNAGDCEGIDYQSAIDAFTANKTEENCMYAVDQLEAAVDAGCLTESQAMSIGASAGLAMCM